MKSKANYISYLSVIASIAVVYLHANGCFWTFSTEGYWKTANIIESVFYFAVPIFFMISGATLIDFYDRYDLKTFFKKRAAKTFFPFLIWSLIAVFLLIIESILRGEPLPVFTEIIKRFISGTVMNVYWFFPVLFCIYLCIPLFAAVSKEKRKEVFSYLAAGCFALNIVIPFFIQTFQIPVDFPYYISVGSGYLFYVLTGYLLHEYDLQKWLKAVIYVLAVAGLLTHLLGTYYASMRANDISQTFKGYNNLPCVLYALGVFVLIKSLVQRKKSDDLTWLDRIVIRLKKYTLSIYLIHYYFIRFSLEVLHMNHTSLWYQLLSPIVIILLTVGVTFVLRKIPGVRRIVPE